MPTVSFNGTTKVISVLNGVTNIDIKTVYSEWKEWVRISDNAKFLPAFNTIGGDPLPGGKFLGTTIFLENNWKIKPYEGSHVLTVTGNIFSRDGSSPFIQTTGNYNVTILSTTSNIVDTVATSGSSINENSIVDAFLDKQNAVETNLTFRQALRLIVAALVGDVSRQGNTTTIKSINGDKNRITATSNSSGRTIQSRDVT